MPLLFTGTTGDRAGHSLMTWVLGNRLKEKGIHVGFMKPFGTLPVQIEGKWTDSDALLFKTVLALPEPLEQICPYLLVEERWRQQDKEVILHEIRSRIKVLSQKKDLLLVMGSKQVFFEEDTPNLPDLSLVQSFAANFVLIHRYRNPSSSLYSILSVHSLIRKEMKGIIINRVPENEIQGVEQKVASPLAQKGIPVAAILREDPILSYRPLHNIVDALQGEILFGEAELHRMVGGFTVGSGDLSGPLSLFKRVHNKVILLQPVSEGNDREMNAPRPIAGVVLTDGKKPAKPLIKAAQKGNVPLILISEDRFTMMDSLEKDSAVLSPDDVAKAHQFAVMLDQEGALDRLLHDCGIP